MQGHNGLRDGIVHRDFGDGVVFGSRATTLGRRIRTAQRARLQQKTVQVPGDQHRLHRTQVHRRDRSDVMLGKMRLERGTYIRI